MALARSNLRGISLWEVDESGLTVWKRREEWVINFALGERVSPAQMVAYLRRHGLRHAVFPTRARAVDALRLALLSEPLTQPVRTRWTRESEGVYRSQGGDWKLLLEERHAHLIPLSARAVERVGRRGARKEELRWVAGFTLRAYAEMTDLINQKIGLPAHKPA